jgi:hypothetical protein
MARHVRTSRSCEVTRHQSRSAPVHKLRARGKPVDVPVRRCNHYDRDLLGDGSPAGLLALDLTDPRLTDRRPNGVRGKVAW